MPDRIVIEFDDEQKPGPENENTDQDRIIIDLDSEKNIPQKNDAEKNYKDDILNSKINSFYKGNSNLSNSYDSGIKFPEGIEQGFRKKFSAGVEDEFFNSILESNRFIVLTSKNGNAYFVDRFSGDIKEKFFFDYQTFEKTGLIYENTAYLNSLKKIFMVRHSEEGKSINEEIYECSNENLIWSNLNRYRNYLLFLEYCQEHRKAYFKIMDLKDNTVSGSEFSAGHFLSDKICVAGDCAYMLYDSSLFMFDLETKSGLTKELEFNTDENSFIFYLNYKLYVTSHQSELFYLDLPPVNYKFRFSGIKNNYANSIGGFGDNIFTGTLDGWKFYKSSGLQVYNFEDEYENKIEAISKNILVVSQKNKIVFYNLNRFQEAEGYVISSKKHSDSAEIISSVISGNEIFVLTNNGMLECYTNDKLNIHI